MPEKSIVILTGAGISAESGLSTFRDNNGLWCDHRVEDVATPEAYVRNPALVHEFYNRRRAQLKEAHPNPAHTALAELAWMWPGGVHIVTQNVDDLHDRAHAPLNGGDQPDSDTGLRVRRGAVLHMHGELYKARCVVSDEIFEWYNEITLETPCPCCKKPGRLRPHIVWFGEIPLYMDVIHHALQSCDLFLSIGTSGNVYPAAGFVQQVRATGKGHTVELNMEPSNGHSMFHEKIYGKAGDVVPAYVKRILAGEII